MHPVVRAGGARRHDAGWRARAGHQLRARSRHRRIQHRRHGALARLQRHLAGRGVGPSLGQPRRHPRDRGLSVAPRHSARREAVDGARRPDRHDQGARNPGRARAGEQLQSRRARPRAAGARGVHRGGDRDVRRLARADRERAVERLDRRRRAAHLSPRAEHRFAQELGGRGRHQSRGAPCIVRAERRNGLSVGIEREDLGFSGCAVQGQATHAGAATGQLRHGKRAVQDQLSGGVPRADSGGVRDGVAPASQGQARAHRAHRHRDPGTRRAHHRQDRAHSRIRRTAITAFNTWWPCR